jgi:hypothetical protein
MKLYKLTQNINKGYETYKAILVCANDPIDAKYISPTGCEVDDYIGDDWAAMEDIQCEYIGEAAAHIQRGVILTDYTGS